MAGDSVQETRPSEQIVGERLEANDILLYNFVLSIDYSTIE